MADRSASDRQLFRFLAGLSLNAALLGVSSLWLAAQFSMVIGWSSLMGMEHSIRIDRDGWIWQEARCGTIAMMHGRRMGVTVRPYEAGESHSTAWERILDNYNFSQPLPGVIAYKSAFTGPLFYRLLGIRHWLVFPLTAMVWCAGQFVLSRTRKRTVTMPTTSDEVDELSPQADADSGTAADSENRSRA